HEVGVKISIDDFGTGYSSLAYLKELPFDEVKIDQSFVQSMTDNSRDSCIVRTIIELGHNLGLRVVGEGVEHRSVLELLRGLGCDIAQGFYLSHPLTHQELERWYKSGPWTNGWACEPAGAA
ncbi:MAG: EAL domain-containing protein, partial [Isosphaeraceae bacterium]